ncbi:hypothetical protein EJB05_05350, partial [Eragrostis curvula]
MGQWVGRKSSARSATSPRILCGAATTRGLRSMQLVDLAYWILSCRRGLPGSYNNFKLEGEYGSLSQRVHKAATRGAEKISSDCSVLKQTCSCDLYPRCHLQGLSCSGDEQTVLAFRLDTLDMIGFTNKTGHWHSFEGSEHLIPGSTGLGFRNDYGSLIGGHMELTKVSVERSSILGAAGILSIHDPNTAVEEEIKLALAKLRNILLKHSGSPGSRSRSVSDGTAKKASSEQRMHSMCQCGGKFQKRFCLGRKQGPGAGSMLAH